MNAIPPYGIPPQEDAQPPAEDAGVAADAARPLDANVPAPVYGAPPPAVDAAAPDAAVDASEADAAVDMGRDPIPQPVYGAVPAEPPK